MATTSARYTDAYVQANGLNFHYLEWGNPAAPTIVCLHGLRGHGHTWDAFAEGMVDDYHLICVDQRGRCFSDWAPDGDYSIQSMVADIRGITYNLGLTNFILVGHSMGSKNSMMYASTYPDTVSRLVLVDLPPGRTEDGPRIAQELARVPEEFEDFEALYTYMRKENTRPPEAVLRNRLKYQTMELPNGKLGWRYDPEVRAQWRQGRTQENVDLWPALPRIPCPTLVVRGMETDALPPAVAAQMVEALPKGELAEVEGAHHMVMEENPTGFTQAVRDFLARNA